MGHDLTLSTEVIAVSNIITSKVVHGLSVTNEDRLSNLHRLSLNFHSVIRVDRVNNPSADIMLVRVYTGFLLARLRRVA